MGGTPAVVVSRLRFGVAAGIGLILIGGSGVFGGAAGAVPQPDPSQVTKQVQSLTTQLDQVGQHYDQVAQQLSQAHGQLVQVQREVASDQAQFLVARAKVAQIAAAAYEDSSQASVAGLLTAGNPSAVLERASVVLQLTGSRNAQTRRLLAAAQQLNGVRQQLQRTEDGSAALRTQLAAQKSAVSKLLASKQATLSSLSSQQQTAVTAGSIGAGGTTTAVYTGPTATQAEKAVAFAYAQLGKPYRWGATGPSSFDCSGLVQAAWGTAGVTIPRVTYDQFSALPHVATAALQPGDLLFYDSLGHVAMYVGGGYIIDAPQTGMDVQKMPMNTGWYAANYDGAARP